MHRKLIFIVVGVITVIIEMVFASFRATRKTPFSAETLISPGISHPKNAAPGFKMFTDPMDLLTENGMNLFGFTADWKDLEPTPGKFTLQEKMINPLTLLIPKYPELKGIVFVLKMIDTNWLPMPTELITKPFDDPTVLKRFDALIDAIAAEPSSNRITHILLGNEIDGYLRQHPRELAAFATFYKRAVNRIHRKIPGVKVSTIITAGTIMDTKAAPLFDEISKFSDFVDYTYYPVEGLERGNVSPAWQMRPVTETEEHLTNLARYAGGKPFAFTEIGYSASPLNNSSEEKQAAFVHEMFRVLTPYQKRGQIEFLLYHNLYDYPPGVCIPYAKQQGVSPDAICSFMENLGLRSYETGAQRKAWNAFVAGVKKWNSNLNQ